MSSIDERIVQMQFQNQQFEKGVQTSLKSIEALKKGLNFEESAKSLSSLEKAGSRFNLSALGSAVDGIASRFTTLGIIGVTALQRITNEAISAGTRITKALTIEPVLTGFQEYETKINAIQTILTNTASKGTTLPDVTKALDELNTYADLTIYNFAEMTRNIGTFTAAGVDLDTAVRSIKGIANLGAGSGSSPQQVATAMYQLSQAIAAGRVSLQDWNSVVNAGMGGELFQNALKKTAKEMGIVVDESVSFRESISSIGGRQSWLTSDVLVKTLESFADNETLVKAATQVKTITQLISTMKESVQSGWAKSWEYIIGDKDQAVETLTAISNGFNDIIQPSTDARNALLQFWNQNGGRTAVINGLTKGFQALAKVAGTIKASFREVFPEKTGEQLVDISKNFENFMAKLTPSEKTLERVGRASKGLFSALDLLRKGVKLLLSPIDDLVSSKGFESFTSMLLEATADVGDFFTKLNESKDTKSFFDNATKGLSDFAGGFSKALGTVSSGVGGLSGILDKAESVIGTVLKKFGEVISWITGNITLSDVFAGLAGGGAFIALDKLGGVFDKISKFIDGLGGEDSKLESAAKSFALLADTIHTALVGLTTGVRVASIVAIAGAVTLLSVSIRSLSKIKAEKILKSLVTIAVVLKTVFGSLKKFLKDFDAKGMVKTSVALIGIAVAIDILTGSIEKLSKLDWEGIGKGLVGVGGMLAELSAFLKITDLGSSSVRGAASLVIIAVSLNVLEKALEGFSSLSWEEIGKGLTAMAGSLLEMAGAIKILEKSKLSVRTSLGMIALAVAAKLLSEALEGFSSLSWEEIGKGLTAMGGALVEMTASLAALSAVGGGGALLGGGAILVAVQSLDEIAKYMKDVSSLSWEDIQKGLLSMISAVSSLSLILAALGKLGGFSSILASGSILIAVQALDPIAKALKKTGSLSWTQIEKGLTAMGAAISGLALVLGLLGNLAPFGSVMAGGGILLAVQSLDEIAKCLKSTGSMSWEEIGKGLTAMGGALGEIAVITGLLGKLAPLGGLLGSGSILIAVQGLSQLADALKEFGSMNWGEIGKGLAGMAGALGATALGSVLNTLSLLGAISIGEVAEPLGILADSVKKWKDVSVPKELPSQLGQLARGVLSFTLGGLGAGALNKAAPGIGELADSISKWKSVSIPKGLEEGLSSISKGVKSFTWAFAGGISIDLINGPLSTLAKTVKKWNDVKIPDGLEEGLSGLADGVKAFSFAFVGGWSIDQIAGPLKTLAGSVGAWNGVVIPENVSAGLRDLASGMRAFEGIDTSTMNFTSISGGLTSLAQASHTLSGIDFPSIVNGLNNFASSVKGLPSEVSGLAESLKHSMSNVADAISSQTGRITGAFNKAMAASIATINGQAGRFSNSGRTIILFFISAIENTLNGNQVRAMSAMSTMCNAMIFSAEQVFKNSSNKFKNFGVQMITKVIEGANSKKSAYKSALETIANSGTTSIRSKYDSFRKAGEYLISGLIKGINNKKSSAIAAAANVAADSLAAAERELDINSPSKKFEKVGMYADEGLAVGYKKYGNVVNNSVESVTSKALRTAKFAFTKINDVVQNIDNVPVIRPVLDLTAVSAGMSEISGLFPMNAPVGLGYFPNTVARLQELNSEMSSDSSPKTPVIDNTDLIDVLLELIDHVDDLGDRIAKMKIVMESGALVGEISQGIDQSLGIIADRKGRNI